METKENKLIAEFMEWDIDDPKTFPKPIQQPIYDGCWGDYRFQTSWDWLMPVVEKIKDIGYDQELDNIDNVITCDLRIENLYKAVVEFIKQYNNERNR